MQLNEAKDIAQLPLKEQFGLINELTMAVHQSGSMMQYYEDNYGVDEEFLSGFDNYNIEPWDKELQEIGVDI